ncbi:hypothetical protein CHARACLAT_002630 [Characodon lateralis]|uniref:Uncharacterized protein n=1 Tax=Characodon lateralis TaxID=208331 RepID=A0ABU7EFT5_9TELE|nr:hypothetical protein [Characodon lateralis]
MWKAVGTKELGHRVDRALAMAKYLAQEIKKREGFRLVIEPEFANVCFWYIPPSLRNVPDCPELWKKLHAVRSLFDKLACEDYFSFSIFTSFNPCNMLVNSELLSRACFLVHMQLQFRWLNITTPFTNV